ncbi:MAG: type VI secretion system ATPase TssH, partial [Treponema sp.]|nr:type VI secretion system ATPase TssH [Treponema sp.]
MTFEKFTLKLQDALQNASSIAQQKDHSEIGCEHILIALLNQQDGIVKPLVERIGVQSSVLLKDLEILLEKYPVVRGNVQMALSAEMQKVLAKSELVMAELHDEYLSTEHVLIAISESDGKVSNLLRDKGITKNSILQSLKSVRGNNRVNSQDPESSIRSLEKYCRDLTSLARLDKIDPVIGRDEEIRRLMQVLARRTKNNPVL